jgi:hypothetical protein
VWPMDIGGPNKEMKIQQKWVLMRIFNWVKSLEARFGIKTGLFILSAATIFGVAFPDSISTSPQMLVTPGNVDYRNANNSQDSFRAFEKEIKRLRDQNDYFKIFQDTLKFAIAFSAGSCDVIGYTIDSNRDSLIVDFNHGNNCRRSTRGYRVEASAPHWTKEKFIAKVNVHSEGKPGWTVKRREVIIKGKKQTKK